MIYTISVGSILKKTDNLISWPFYQLVLSDICLFIYFKNYGAFFDKVGAGITGPVKLEGSNGASIDLSSQQWTYQVAFPLKTNWKIVNSVY